MNALPMKTGRKYGKKQVQIVDATKQSWLNLYSDQNYDTNGGVNFTTWHIETNALYRASATGATFYSYDLVSAYLSTAKGTLTQDLMNGTPMTFYDADPALWPLNWDDYAKTRTNSFAGLTVNDLKKNTFGVDINIRRTASGSNVSLNTLRITDFGMTVPREITFRAVELAGLTGMDQIPVGGGVINYEAYFAGTALDVKYDYIGTLGGTDAEQGYFMIDNMPQPTISQKKTYQYNVSKNGKFLNEYDNVTSDPVIKNSVNQMPGELDIKIGRDLESTVNEFDDLAITGYDVDPDDNNTLLTHTQEPILATIKVAAAVGDGTDIAKNNYIDLKEYYGGFESLLTSDGEELLTSDLEPMLVENGYPMGRSMFKGFISKYGYGYDAAGQFTSIKVLNHVDELNNIVLEKQDTAKVTNTVGTLGSYVKNNRIYRDALAVIREAQTFTPSSTFVLSAVSIFAVRGGYTETPASDYPSVTVQIKVGVPSGSGAILATATKKIDNFTGLNEHIFSFEGVTVSSGTLYSIIIQPTNMTSLDDPSAGGDFVGFSVAYSTANPYASGARYNYQVQPYNLSKTYADPGWATITNNDLNFKLWERGGDTKVSMNSMSPAAIVRQGIDYARTRNSQINYTATSLAESGTIVSIPFNTNKIYDVVAAALKSSPSDWYTYYDPASLIVNLLPRPDVVKHWFTLGLDIETLYLEEDIEDLVNEVYFTGGAVSGGANLMKRFVDALSQQQIRRGLAIISDNRVTDPTTAQIMAQAEIDRKKNAVIVGKVRVLRRFYEEVVDPGDLCGFRAFGNHIDFLRLQAVNIETTPDFITADLGVMLPPVSKRVEDIRRNLQLLEMQNNPTAPS